MDDITEYRVQMAADYLEYVRTLKRRRDAAIAVANEFTGVKGIDYQREMVNASPSDDALVNLVEKRREAKARMDEAVSEYDDAVQDAWRRIQSMRNNSYVQVLTLRYIKDISWERISVDMGYSYHHVMRIKRRALLAFYDSLPADWKAPRNR